MSTIWLYRVALLFLLLALGFSLWTNGLITRDFQQAVEENIVGQRQALQAIRGRESCTRVEWSNDLVTWFARDHLGTTPLRFVRLRNYCSGISVSLDTEAQ